MAGQPLTFALPKLSGEKVALSGYAGRVVLVDLWATWCKPCEASFPFYAELYARHHDLGFELLAISVDLHDEAVADFLAKAPVPFTVLRDPEGSVPSKLGVETMPTAVLVGRDGRVRWVHAGFVEDDRPGIEAQVKAALDEAQTATSTAP